MEETQPYKSHHFSQVKKYILRTVSVAALCLGNSIFGPVGGYTSPTETQLIRPGLFTTFTFSVFSSLTLYGVASLIVAPFANKLGSKFLLILASLANGIGWFLIILGHDIYSMMIGRVLTGVQIGAFNTLATIYMSEISSEKYRAFFTAIILMPSSLNAFLTYLLGNYMSFRWLGVYAQSILFVQTILLIFCPQSPTWLVLVGYEKKAKRNLRLINGEHYNAEEEIENIRSSITSPTQHPSKNPIAGVTQWVVLKPIMIACGLQFFKGFSGQSTFYSYAASLFSRTGLNANISSLPYPILLTLGHLISALLAKRVSRKKLLISTTAMQGLANLSFFLYFLITRHIRHCSHPFSSIGCSLLSLWPVLNLSAYSLFYGIGWGTISWSMFADSFHPNYKEVSAGIVTFWYTIIVTIIVLIFPNFVSLFGDWPFFLFLAIECLFAIGFEFIFFEHIRERCCLIFCIVYLVFVVIN